MFGFDFEINIVFLSVETDEEAEGMPYREVGFVSILCSKYIHM